MPDAVSTVFDSLVAAEPPTGCRALFDTACVLGGSISGLLAARVLSDFARRVVIIERDRLGKLPSPRSGVPQDQQVHVLLPAGRQWLERWVPGFTDAALKRGAVISAADNTLRAYGDRSQTMCGREYGFLCATRPLIESSVRARVLARPNISVTSAYATGLRYWSGALTGVEFVKGSGAGVLEVDFVVDAMGRSSRVSNWVSAAGFERPRLERLALPVNYATALFERTAATADPDVWCISEAFTAQNSVDGVYLACANVVENNQWIVGLVGYGNDHPGISLDDFRTTCSKLGPIFNEAVSGRPTRAVHTYHQMESRRRHFTDVGHFPARLVCVGDAVASFNPSYGQGMSSAALHASCLFMYLSGCEDFDAVATDFFRIQDVAVDAAWAVSTAGDAERVDFMIGAKVSDDTRYQRWASDQVLRASLVDNGIAEIARDVNCMLRHPSALTDPAIVQRCVAVNLAASEPPTNRSPAPAGPHGCRQVTAAAGWQGVR